MPNSGFKAKASFVLIWCWNGSYIPFSKSDTDFWQLTQSEATFSHFRRPTFWPSSPINDNKVAVSVGCIFDVPNVLAHTDSMECSFSVSPAVDGLKSQGEHSKHSNHWGGAPGGQHATKYSPLLCSVCCTEEQTAQWHAWKFVGKPHAVISFFISLIDSLSYRPRIISQRKWNEKYQAIIVP